LVEEKVERILALVEERRGEVERRVREESGNDATKQAKPQESAKPASPSPAASTSTTSSSGASNAGWEQKRPYAPASSSQVHSAVLNPPRFRHAQCIGDRLDAFAMPDGAVAAEVVPPQNGHDHSLVASGLFRVGHLACTTVLLLFVVVVVV
jgi:hypothetical protein